MSDFKSVDVSNFQTSPFQLIGKYWMLITAKKQDKVNAMTASWGGLGVMWNKNVAYTVIRPQRFTKEFVDSTDEFSLCFLDDNYKKTLHYFGSVSGRDENKIEKSELTVLDNNNIPYFKESKLVIFCKKIFCQQMTPDSFFDKTMNDTFYPEKDHHYMYISEIKQIFSK